MPDLIATYWSCLIISISMGGVGVYFLLPALGWIILGEVPSPKYGGTIAITDEVLREIRNKTINDSLCGLFFLLVSGVGFWTLRYLQAFI